MSRGRDPKPEDPRVALLFTRFPVATETFLLREVALLKQQPVHCEVFRLWPGGTRGAPAMQADESFHPLELCLLPFWIAYWLWLRPKAMGEVAASLLRSRMVNVTNVAENLLGMGVALIRAKKLAGRYTHLHAVWASAPAAAAWVTHLLTGMPFSMAGHAYDLYEDGGDGWLAEKLPGARFIRTSTEAGKSRWIFHGAHPASTYVIRRGLAELPRWEQAAAVQPPYRLLSVGRCVEKMGHGQFLRLVGALKSSGLPVQAVLIGGGPFLESLKSQAAAMGLRDQLRFTGALPYEQVEEWYRWAHLFVFMGIVAGSGDRAGLPNALAEAMAWGVPVVASRVGAVPEAVRPGVTGILHEDMASTVGAVRTVLANPEAYAALRAGARAWVEEAYDGKRNMADLAELILKAHRQSRGSGA